MSILVAKILREVRLRFILLNVYKLRITVKYSVNVGILSILDPLISLG